MPRYDIYHDAVRNALIKDGWTITHDPLPVTFGRRNLYIDLGAETPLAAEKDGRKIAVEIKSFVSNSEVTDFTRALGQYLWYRSLLARQEPERALYLAVGNDIADGIFEEPEARDFMKAQSIRLLVFDPAQEVVLRWQTP